MIPAEGGGAARAGFKLAGLAAAGTASFLTDDLRLLALGLLATVSLWVAARQPLAALLGAARPMLPVLGLIVVAQGFADAWAAGWAASIRLLTLGLLAGLVTSTTPAGATAAALAGLLAPLRWAGIDPARPALALALTLRLVPVIAAEAAAVREAARARGLERRPLALLVPLLVRVIKLADDLGDAIEARGGLD